jgi:acetyl esterase
MGQLDPAFETILNQFASLPAISDGTVEQARQGNDLGCQLGISRVAPMHEVKDEDANGVRVRIYLPVEENQCRASILYFHGGGFVVGSLEGYDHLMREIAEMSQSVVISVGYRLAPEHPFPAAVEDANCAWKWLCHNPLGERPRIVAGDSAGGCLAAVVAIGARDDGVRIDGQLLWYPAVGLDENLSSVRDFGEGYFLTRKDIEWFGEGYLGSRERRLDWRVDPALHPDLSGLAPAVVVVAEFDPLRDGGCNYARKLTECGVETHLEVGQGMIHGFANMIGLVPAARKIVNESLELAVERASA